MTNRPEKKNNSGGISFIGVLLPKNLSQKTNLDGSNLIFRHQLSHINKDSGMKEARKNYILSLAQESKYDTVVSFTPPCSFGERVQSCLGNKVALAFFGKDRLATASRNQHFYWMLTCQNRIRPTKNISSINLFGDQVPPIVPWSHAYTSHTSHSCTLHPVTCTLLGDYLT